MRRAAAAAIDRSHLWAGGVAAWVWARRLAAVWRRPRLVRVPRVAKVLPSAAAVQRAQRPAELPAGGPPMMMGAGGGGGIVGMGSGMMAAGPARPNLRGRALLSWRVAILPFLGEERLYKQFRLHEPWDSPHNKSLLARMPDVFASARSEVQPGHTSYLVFVGPGSAFDGRIGVKWEDFKDGHSNTILIVEAGEPVPWSKPEDIAFGPDSSLELRCIFRDGFRVGMADGSVRFIPKEIDRAKLRAAITRNGGETIGLDH